MIIVYGKFSVPVGEHAKYERPTPYDQEPIYRGELCESTMYGVQSAPVFTLCATEVMPMPFFWKSGSWRTTLISAFFFSFLFIYFWFRSIFDLVASAPLSSFGNQDLITQKSKELRLKFIQKIMRAFFLCSINVWPLCCSAAELFRKSRYDHTKSKELRLRFIRKKKKKRREKKRKKGKSPIYI